MPGTMKKQPLGHEELVDSEDCDKFIKAIHNLEPLPLAFYETLKTFGIELNEYLL